MPMKYICAVNRDWDNNELELVQTKLYDTIDSEQGQNGVIKFSNGGEMQQYFKDHCVSYDDLKNNNTGYVVLFYILLFILLGMLVYNLVNKNMFSNTDAAESVASAFGRFNKFGKY